MVQTKEHFLLNGAYDKQESWQKLLVKLSRTNGKMPAQTKPG